MNRLTLHTHEASHLAAHGRVVIVREVEPQPLHDDKAWACYFERANREGQYGPPAWRLDEKPGEDMMLFHPFPTGSQWWGAEEWAEVEDGYGGSHIMYRDGSCWIIGATKERGDFLLCETNRYGNKDYPSRPKRFRAASRQPQSASRFPSLTVTSATCKQVQDITHDEALAAGCKGERWVSNSPYIAGPHTDDGTLPVEELQQLLGQLNPSLTPSSWVWLTEIQTPQQES